MKNFIGKTILVSGGSRGIGAATVKLFAQLGGDIAFNYLKNERSAKEVKKNCSDFPGKIYYSKCDISEFKEVEKFVQMVITQLGGIDILINNAGIWTHGPVDTMSNENWQQTIQTNLNSVFYFTKLVVLHMKKTNTKGKIVHVASTAAQRGEAFHSHYAASKGAIISFTKSLASELGPFGIHVNCVAPGWVQTDMSTQAIADEGDKIISTIPLGRIPTADEIAAPIVFLASEWATAITGEILNVNAGSVLCG